jgi:hypothetical protein
VLGIFRNNNPLALLLLLGLGYVSIFLKPVMPYVHNENDNQFIFHWFMQLLTPLEKKPGTGIKIFAFIALISEALYLNKIARDYKLLEKSTYVIALTFLLMSFLIPYRISIFMLTINALIIVVFNAFISMYKTNNPFNQIMVVGFITSAVSAVVNNYFIFYAWLTIALLIMRPTSLREWSILNLGFILPYYFLSSLLYLTNQFSFDALLQLQMPSFTMPMVSTIHAIKISCIVMLPLIGFWAGSAQISKMVLQNRKAFIILFSLLLAGMCIVLLNIGYLSEYLYLLLVPASMLFAPFFQSFKRDFIPNLVLILLIILSYIR